MKIHRMIPYFAALAATALLFACSDDSSSPAPPQEPGALHENADFPIGVAVGVAQWEAGNIRDDARTRAIVEKHFNSLTAANVMKFKYLQPEPGVYYWDDADWFVDYAEEHGMEIHGHTLIWHQQLPAWVESYPGSIDSLMVAHIKTVVGRYRGRIKSWDVVNEAFLDNGDWRPTIWFESDSNYVAKCFEAAHAADPDAELYYNDYNLAAYLNKSESAIELCYHLSQLGIGIVGLGMQMHVLDNFPSKESIIQTLEYASYHDFRVRISEMDVSMNFFKQHTAWSDELAQKQRERFKEIVALYNKWVRNNFSGGITVWGVSDAHSWIRDVRMDWPLLFDENYQPKPAFFGFEAGLKE